MDTSMLVPMHIKEVNSALADDFIASVVEQVVVSDYAAGEFASVIARLVRTRQVDADAGRILLSDFDSWCATDARRVATEAPDIRLASAMVRDVAIPLQMPDAVHAAASRRLGATLVTLDQQLARAARAMNVDVFVPS